MVQISLTQSTVCGENCREDVRVFFAECACVIRLCHKERPCFLLPGIKLPPLE